MQTNMCSHSSINPQNKTYICIVIDEVYLFILKPLANIVGDYLRPSFDKTKYNFRPA